LAAPADKPLFSGNDEKWITYSSSSNNLVKYLHIGETEVRALRGITLHHQDRRLSGHHGTLRLGQIDDDETSSACLDKPDSGQIYFRGDGSLHHGLRRPAGPYAQQEDRLRLPVIQPAGADDRLGERRAAPRYLFELFRARNSKSGLWRRSNPREGQGPGPSQDQSTFGRASSSAWAIARALLNNPSLILADEPTGNLDSKTSDEIMTIFRNLNQDKGITIVMVTHEADIGAQAKKRIFMRDGPDHPRGRGSLRRPT